MSDGSDSETLRGLGGDIVDPEQVLKEAMNRGPVSIHRGPPIRGNNSLAKMPPVGSANTNEIRSVPRGRLIRPSTAEISGSKK